MGIFKTVNSEIKDGLIQIPKLWILLSKKAYWRTFFSSGLELMSVIGGGLTEKNFLGKGIKLDTNLQFSNEGVKGSLTYSKPNFNYTDNTLFTSVKSTSQDNLSTS